MFAYAFCGNLSLNAFVWKLDMEAVIWLEDYLSKWNRILLLVSHSQDFLNNVCTHMIHFTSRKQLQYYDGNYDQFVKTKQEKEENQWKQYKWEQEQIKSMKEYIARFGHGTAKNAKQAQSKEKVLAKMVRAGLTDKPEEEKPLNFKFSDPGHLPPPVLAFHDVSFGYPGCEPLYTNVNFGVDLDSRVALVGPNGAGKVSTILYCSAWHYELFPQQIMFFRIFSYFDLVFISLSCLLVVDNTGETHGGGVIAHSW